MCSSAVLLLIAVTQSQVTIDSHRNEQIVFQSTIDASGTAPDGEVVVSAGSQTWRVRPRKGRWTVNQINLEAKVNEITAEANGSSASIFISYCPTDSENYLVQQSEQKVFFKWDDGVDEILEEIAELTLRPNPPSQLTKSSLATFVEGVRRGTVAVFSRTFAGVANVLVISREEPDVHVVRMRAAQNGGKYGETVYDYGNRQRNGESMVYVKEFLAQIKMCTQMSDQTFQNYFSPMIFEDPLPVRIVDISEALGRTAAHEAAHGFGLVGGDSPDYVRKGLWMCGSNYHHRLRGDIVVRDRINLEGESLMVDGNEIAFAARIGRRLDGSFDRKSGRFCLFDREYFSNVLPVRN